MSDGRKTLDEASFSRALHTMLKALDEPTPPLVSLLSSGARDASAAAATADNLAGPTRGATEAAGEAIRTDQLLVTAASRGDLPMVRELLDRGAVAAARNQHLLTALHWAVTLGHTQVAELLLERGAPINARDAVGLTPLHQAAREGDAAMARLLLERGADPHALCNDRRTPLDLALIFAEDEPECAAALRQAMTAADGAARLRIRAQPARATCADDPASDGAQIIRPACVSTGASLRTLGVAGEGGDGDAGASASVSKRIIILDASALATAFGEAAQDKHSVSCGCGPDEPMRPTRPPVAATGGGGAELSVEEEMARLVIAYQAMERQGAAQTGGGAGASRKPTVVLQMADPFAN